MDDVPHAAFPVPTKGEMLQPFPMVLSINSASLAKLLDLIRETVEAAVAKPRAQARFETDPAPRTTESPPLSSTKTGIELKPTIKAKAADLRLALLTGKIPEHAGLLIDARTFAKLLSISSSTLWRLQAEQAIPAPIKVGHLSKWRPYGSLDKNN